MATGGLVAGCSSPAPTPPPATAPVSATPNCDTSGAVSVSRSDQLARALAAATPGTVIVMAAGTYAGPFTATASGTAGKPITLCGGRDTVIDGGDTARNYTLHLDGASYWQLSGFTLRGGQKGLMVDRGRGDLVQGLLIENTGDEGLHLRQGSTDNVVRGNEIRHTGLLDAKFGEGVYVGTAESNWCEISSCVPDRSDRNTIEGNTISDTTAESVDIKEGTTGGMLRGNSFSGKGMTAAEAWVNVKGNGWTIADNTGVDAPQDGFQVHQILDGWGLDNTFTGNKATVNGDGYAINITKNRDENRVECDNTSIGAGKGLSTVTCVQ
ncbi:nitrous oxide reductase family maturation protein NosD [Pseudonocardia sp.]|jgi:parallel beta-helix repeat protein|uniref:right-handed parallel beta-helix repeat-containing protein n=1 Tax=Pseudonocardia sp. TaxID=60912 RepID=UPI002619AF71|nr:right-handed parallel beta-helix repeat-containing protein [Pseudonocardia sp.]